tara:strand:+ start:266 stop:2014 length:1749 start_codon:yes stop_codon:yes gene_type:complete
MNQFHFLPLAALLLVATNGSLEAQNDSLDMDVTFVGKRQMEVRDAVKLSSWPSLRALSSEKPQLQYDLLSKRLQFDPTMTPVEATRLRVDPSLSRLYRGFVQAVVGTRGTTLLDASYTDLRSRDGSWGTALHHAATASPSSLLDGRLNANQVEAWGSRFVGKEKIDVNVRAGQSRILLYGFDSLAVDSTFSTMDAPQVTWKHLGGDVSFKSHHKDSTTFNHEVHVTVGWLSNDLGTQERHFLTEAMGSKYIGKEKLEASATIQLDRSSIKTAGTSSQAIVTLNPNLITRRGALTASVGLGLAIDADQPSRDGIGESFHLYPRAQVSVNLLRNLFIPYAQLGGELQANNFHRLLRDNPFFAPSALDSPVYINAQQVNATGFRSTNKRLALSGGVRGTITEVFRFHGYFSTAQYEDFLLFTPTLDAEGFTEFEAVYDTLGIRTIGGEVSFDLGDTWSFAGGMQLNSYTIRTEDRPWHLPKVAWNASASYKVIEGLNVSADVRFVGERYALSESDSYGETTSLGDGRYELRLPSFIDLNLSANYRYNDRLGASFTLANIANARYANWGGYPVQGIQALAGVHYAF